MAEEANRNQQLIREQNQEGGVLWHGIPLLIIGLLVCIMVLIG